MGEIIIDKIDFWDMESERYWSPTKGKNLKEMINNAIFSGEYFAARKVDGHYFILIKDMEGNFILRGRSKSTVTDDYTDKIDFVPHIKEELSFLPNGTVLVGEIYFPNNEGSKVVTTIMGCKVEKALQRQRDGEKLHFYIFDVLAWDNKSLLNTPIKERVGYFKSISNLKKAMSYVELATYYDGQELWDYLIYCREKGYEGIVLQRKDNIYEPGKRTARKTIKVKKELDNEVDCFITGNYKPATLLYTGREVETWPYWMVEKSGKQILVDSADFARLSVTNSEEFIAKYYSEYAVPITKGAFFGWCGSIELGVLDGDKVVPIGWTSNITEEIKKGVVSEPDTYKYKVARINAMERDNESGLFRHLKVMEWRNDISYKDCTIDKVGI